MSQLHLLDESLIGLREAAHQLPPGRRGKPVSFSCVFRWITNGIPGPDGKRVRLEAIRVGGRWLTSKQALARWAEQLTPRMDAGTALVARTQRQRSRATEKAEIHLANIGI